MKNRKYVFLIKCLLAAIPFILFSCTVSVFPMHFFSEGYPIRLQQKDFVNTTHADVADVLFFGDSKIKSGIIPELVADSSYNLALGGSSPIEMYYSLKAYLSNNPAPKTVLLSYSPQNYAGMEKLWMRINYTHYFYFSDYFDIIKNISQLDAPKIIPKYWNSNVLDYALWSPFIYSDILVIGLSEDRYSSNSEVYNELHNRKGHHYYGTEESNGEINVPRKMNFNPPELMIYYMNETILLCHANGITVIIEHTPFNLVSYNVFMESDYYQVFIDYLSGFEQRYSNVYVSKNFLIYEDDCFGDSGGHMNERGARAYSLYLKETYFSDQ